MSNHSKTKHAKNSHSQINLNNLTHHFLVASPQMPDERFNQAVIYICQHDKEGALGLIINQPLDDVNMSRLLEDLEIACTRQTIGKQAVLAGGPVHGEVGFIIHTGQPTWASSFAISENICLTTSLDVLHSIATVNDIKRFLVCLGYSSWYQEQLVEEITQGDWLVCPADLSLLFETPYEDRWHVAGKNMGVNLHYFSEETGHA